MRSQSLPTNIRKLTWLSPARTMANWPHFSSESSSHKLTSRTHIVGPLYGTDKFAAFRHAACFCLPSRQEGFSVAILESLSAGTPVVISQACHFPEVAEQKAGEVVPLETPAIAAALDRLLSNSSLRDQMGIAGQEMVHRNFTWPKIAEQTIAAYERAINSRRSQPS